MNEQFLYLSIISTGTAPTGVGGGNFANVHLLNTDLSLSGGGAGGTTNIYNSTIITGGTTSNVTQYVGPGISAGTVSQGTGVVIFGGTTGNVTFGLGTDGHLTADAPGGSAPAGIGLNTAVTGVIGMTGNSSGLSISIPAFLTTAQPPGAYLTTAMASNEPHIRQIVYGTETQTSGSIVLSGSNGITVRATAGSAVIEFDGHHLDALIPSGNGYGTGFSSMTSGTIGLSAGQGVSFSQNGNLLGMQVATNYLTTARASNDAVGLASGLTNLTGTINSNGISLSAAAPGAGPSISQYWAVPPWQGGGGGNLITNLSATAMTQRPFFMPFEVGGNLTAGEIHWQMSRASAVSNLFTVDIGIYSFSNSSKLNLIGSTRNLYQQSDTASVSGLRLFEADMGAGLSTLSQGQYVLAMAFSATATAQMNYSLLGGSTSNNGLQTAVISGTNAYHTYLTHHAMLFFGRYTTTSGVIPATVGLTDVNCLLASRVPLFFTLGNHV